MRVCFVTPSYFPVVGGAESHIATLAEGVAREGHDVVVVTDRPPATPGRERVAGVEVVRVTTALDDLAPDRVMWEDRVFGLLTDLGDALGSEPVDIVHAHCQVSVVLAAMAASELGCGLVATMHETVPEDDSFGRARSALVYGHLPYDALVVGSAAFERQALRHGAPLDRIHRIGYGIDLDRWRPVDEAQRRAERTQLGLADDDRAILLVGRFKARKGQLTLLEALAEVLQEEPRAVAVLVGGLNCASERYLADVREVVAGLGNRARIVESRLPFSAMPDLYAAADIVVQPSLQEGFGLAVAEAMACARPVVVTHAAGLDEVATDDTAVRVPLADAAALARALVGLLADDRRAGAMAQRARERAVAQFDSARMVVDHLRLYEEIVSRRRPPRPGGGS